MNRDEILALADIMSMSQCYPDREHFARAVENAAIESYKAELLKEVGEPVAARRKVAMWQGGDDYKYEWVVVKEHTPGTEPLYTSGQLAAAILKATKPLEEEIERLKDEQFKRLEREAEKRMKLREQLATAEQRVSEACAEYVLIADHDDDPYIIAGEIRSGKWREYLKGE